ncbi:MAG: hypothetical protein ACOZDY_00985 [Pseudomonadota bacterium]
MTLLAGCMGGAVELPGRMEQPPLVEKLDVTVGASFPGKSRGYVLPTPVVRIHVGESSAARFRQAWDALFARVVDLPDLGACIGQQADHVMREAVALPARVRRRPRGQALGRAQAGGAMKRLLAALLVSLIAPLAPAAEPPPVVGLVWWPADPADPRHKFGRETEECLAASIRAHAPGVRIVPRQKIRDALYPRLEPATQPPTEEAFAELLARPAVQERLRGLGLTHLVAFTGGTDAPPFQGGILCGTGYGGGGCLGFAWQDKTTTLAAALWDLERRERVAQEKARTEGTTIVPAFVLPIPLIADTHTAACQELGAQVARGVLGRPLPPQPSAPER